MIVNVVLVALSVALLGVAFAVEADDDDDEKASERRSPRRAPEQQRPPPLMTTIRRRSPVGRFQKATCRRQSHTVENPTRWFHPAGDNFYPPGKQAPARADLDHRVRTTTERSS